jgi:uncharacterized glyoxalase superfamily protein PhnB
MSRVFPFISVDDARKAIEIYKQAFTTEEIGMPTYYKEFYDDPSIANKIAHMALSIEGSPLFINDAHEQPDSEQTRFTVNVEVASIDKVYKAFDALKKNAKNIFYKPTNLGWSDLGFSLKDQFGVIWMVYIVEK